MRKITLISLSVLALALLAFAPGAFAGSDKGREVIKRGKCSGHQHWKLKTHLDDGRLETEFEVDQNRVGRRWRVTLVQNGRTVFSGVKRTVAPSGSFEARRMLAEPAGRRPHRRKARALAGGETCAARSPSSHVPTRPEKARLARAFPFATGPGDRPQDLSVTDRGASLRLARTADLATRCTRETGPRACPLDTAAWAGIYFATRTPQFPA